MQVEIAKILLPWVNKKEFEKYIHEFTEERLRILREQLETLSDPREIYLVQGQIKEVKQIKYLRQKVLDIIERDKGY